MLNGGLNPPKIKRKEREKKMNELQDILEGVILEHKDKKDIEILEIIEQDLYFKHLKKEDIIKYIRETKEIYKGGN